MSTQRLQPTVHIRGSSNQSSNVTAAGLLVSLSLRDSTEILDEAILIVDDAGRFPYVVSPEPND